jgi:hypothetical protein
MKLGNHVKTTATKREGGREGGKWVEGGRTRGKWEDESREIARFLLGEGVRF